LVIFTNYCDIINLVNYLQLIRSNKISYKLIMAGQTFPK
jgi:hypothetical protein